MKPEDFAKETKQKLIANRLVTSSSVEGGKFSNHLTAGHKYQINGGLGEESLQVLRKFATFNHIKTYRFVPIILNPQVSNKTRWWFEIFLYFHPYLGKIPILTNIFASGLKPPTRKILFMISLTP